MLVASCALPLLSVGEKRPNASPLLLMLVMPRFYTIGVPYFRTDCKLETQAYCTAENQEFKKLLKL